MKGGCPALARVSPPMRRLLLSLTVLVVLLGDRSVARGQASRARPSTTVSGTVTDGTQPLPGTFVGLVLRSDVESLSNDWSRVDVALGVETDANGNYLIDTTSLGPAAQYWLCTGSLTRFNVFSNGTANQMGGLPALPTRGDLIARSPTPILNDQSYAGVDFELLLSNVLEDVPVPVGTSGVTLLTDIYGATTGTFPTEGTPGNPVLLLRTPYDKGGTDPDDPTAGALLAGYLSWTAMGYTLVVQNTRGRNGSSGSNEVFRTDAWGLDAQDGADTINWIASQPWCDGTVGVVGPSALAITGYLAAGASPNALKAGYGWAGTSNLYELFFDGGAYRQEAMDRWLSGMLGGDAARDAWLSAPGGVADNAARTAWWDGVDLATRPGFVRVPMLHLVGWFDLFKDNGIRSFQLLNALGATATSSHAGAFGNQRLLIGPWSHVDWFNADQGDLVFPNNAGPSASDPNVHPSFQDTLVFKSELRFFDHWLRLEPRGLSDGYELEAPVRYYVVGNTDPGGLGNFWRETDSWPPSDLTVVPRRFHFTGYGSRLLELSDDPRTFPARWFLDAKKSYVYDPTDPVPTLGGPILYATSSDPAGPRDQRPIEARPDVLTFTSLTLQEPMELAGEVVCHLAFSTDALDTDFVVKLCDVYPDGRSIAVAEGVLQARYRGGLDQPQLLSGNPRKQVQVDVSLGEVSLVLDAGHRFRVSVTSSDAPRLKPNPNTGASFFPGEVTAANSQIAHTTIWARPFLPKTASWVDLPTVQR